MEEGKEGGRKITKRKGEQRGRGEEGKGEDGNKCRGQNLQRAPCDLFDPCLCWEHGNSESEAKQRKQT